MPTTELSEHRKFNVFRFADKTISENAWSRVFAWLLNSTEDHDLDSLPFKTWLQLALGEQLGVTKFARNEGIILTRTEVPTEEGRRIDILVNVFDKRSRTQGVIGIENKVWSGEQNFQVADYQADLNKRSAQPAIFKRLVFLTPEGRKSATADDNSPCKCVPASYNTITDLCGALSRSKKCNPNLVNLLKQMKSYLEKEITGTRETKQLVHRLYAEKKYRAALRLISQNMPSTFDVFAELKEHVENALRKRKVEHSWWPPKGGNPPEVRLLPTELGTLTKRGRGPFEVNYGLTCDEDEPDIGDKFKLIVAAYCYNKAAVQKAKEFRGTPPETSPWREDTRWFWVTIWTGNEYRLKDLGSADAKALSVLVIDAIDQTYSRLLRKAARMRT